MPRAKAKAKAEKPATPVKQTVKPRGDISTRFTSKNNPGKGRPTGAKNKISSVQLQAAREAFTPLAKLGLEKGKTHLTKCKLEGCGACQFWAKLSFDYAYGKPTQPIEFNVAALNQELESIAAAAGKSVDEIKAEAREAGVRVMADYAVSV